ncbi:MAG: LysM peptidoglycan-binding domain-containing protein [Planctomycetota bacterium]|nr:LysM peptidoglycan-binding domain-containing protein [Planctomycetota bacterium]
MGTTSKILLVGIIILIAGASSLLDREFAGSPPPPPDPILPMANLAHIADAPPSATIAYRVRNGDTLDGIARRVYGDPALAKLIRDSRHRTPKSLKPGQTLFLPGHPPPSVRRRSYVVREGDSLYKIAERILGDGDRWRVIYDANRDTLKSPQSLESGQVLKIRDDL